MWHPKGSASASKKGGGNGLIAVAVDKDKGSQHAVKWATEHLLSRGQTVVLIHVIKPTYNDTSASVSKKCARDHVSEDLFLSYHCLCSRKDIECIDIVLEDSDVVRALTEYVSHAAIEKLVLGAPARSGFMRKFRADTPSSVTKAVPDFCTVYVISKGKISSIRNSTRSAPFSSPLLDQIRKLTPSCDQPSNNAATKSEAEKPTAKPRTSFGSTRIENRLPLPSTRPALMKAFDQLSGTDNMDISFVSSDRPSTDRNSSLMFDSFIDSSKNSRFSTSTDHSMKWSDAQNLSYMSLESARPSTCSSQNLDEVEVEMRRLKQELKQTMDLYSNACREALTAKQQAMELNRYKNQEEQRLEEAKLAEEAAMSAAEAEKARCKVAIEAAEVAKRHAESNKTSSLEAGALRDAKEVKKMMDALSNSQVQYRRYMIEDIEEATDNFAASRKIGEGGYGPVYMCYLDHTPVAVKVLRPDAAQGRIQFLKEIEVLSCIRHPNMVLLLGACPEYGILVYEYMSNGSLDDCLFPKARSQALSWQIRFRIAAEVATGLLFLHQSKPEPIVHRDLKPANILLDENYVSKIGDVGLARLVPAIAENVTQVRMTSAAGTFCYIDPEYQQTGVLGVKSDVYSLGILLLQLITGKQPMGLAHYTEQAIERGTFLTEMLDPAVPDWPQKETMELAKLSIRCAELRRKDRPDLGKEILPMLCKIRDMAEEQMDDLYFAGSPPGSSP